MWKFLSPYFGIEVRREAAARLAREVGGNQKVLKAFGLAEFAGEGGVGMGKAKPYHGWEGSSGFSGI